MTDEYDDDNPRWTKADFARARGPEAMTEAELAAFPNTKRIGRPPKETPKVAVSLRLDADVVEHFKATGAGWQTRINTALRDMIANAPLHMVGRSASDEVFQERSIELRETGEQVVTGKEAFITGQFSVRKDVGQRTEQVRDTVRHTEIEVERVAGRPKRGTKSTLQRER